MISADSIRGYVDIMVLAILERAPSYAYEIAKIINQEAAGQYTIKQTTLYSAVKRLEASGYVSPFEAVSDSGKTRTYYQLTPAGQGALTDKCAEWETTKVVVDRFVEGRR
ncbi:PadR family transcriptional regulator [Scrofimicrobium sp. R131]|uniref:PadR family transcriptional regulator n=1 Tax=Scrofimicrobium appendicitidis TaxID=3079930 RepID=A0AAU7V5R0_9ACTO